MDGRPLEDTRQRTARKRAPTPSGMADADLDAKVESMLREKVAEVLASQGLTSSGSATLDDARGKVLRRAIELVALRRLTTWEAAGGLIFFLPAGMTPETATGSGFRRAYCTDPESEPLKRRWCAPKSLTLARMVDALEVLSREDAEAAEEEDGEHEPGSGARDEAELCAWVANHLHSFTSESTTLADVLAEAAA